MKKYLIIIGLIAAIIFTFMVVVKRANASPVYIGGCSGVYIGKGYILTASHCTWEKTSLNVQEDITAPLGFTAHTIWNDRRRDLALIRLDVPDDDHPFKASKVSCEYPKLRQHYLIKGWPANLGYTEVIGYIAGFKGELGPWAVSYVTVAPIFYGNSGSGGYNLFDEVEVIVVGLLEGTSLAVVVPTAEICDLLPRGL